MADSRRTVPGRLGVTGSGFGFRGAARCDTVGCGRAFDARLEKRGLIRY